ncbi:hypothetical protein [Psychrobacillus lasiicapitis]|uniref:Uncharacterized protein n=1 Tax=Psychrobacillus lasiicapitis TaxID=1636719 RepID=A0A544TAB9_9BACI|nr:hypothetical protein [Psychrobacillus lasiicapitis]TQR14403.1 hypothetical protein FG382_08065 [Psychrobacillus lasiicapitis]GGA31654.1 hypothetical protein GCM10011384_21480 [Psychrobacillus lasiicapitis]
MKGLIISEGKVSRVLSGIININRKENTITFNEGLSKLQNINFEAFEMVVDIDQSELSMGDNIPEDFIDKSNLITVEPQDALIDALGQELTSIKMELMMMKGVGSI